MGRRKNQRLLSHYWHQALFAVSRSTSDFGVEPGSELPTSVRQLIDYIASARNIAPDEVVSVVQDPTDEEVKEQAFQILRSGLLEIGGKDAVSIDSRIPLNELMPTEDRSIKWRQLGEILNYELPQLAPSPWSLWPVVAVTYVLFNALLVAFFAVSLALVSVFAGVDVLPVLRNPPWYVSLVVFPVMYFGALFGGLAAGFWVAYRICRLHEVPYGSIKDFVFYITVHSHGLKESLRRDVSTTIERRVKENVAKFYDRDPDSIGLDFSLDPKSHVQDVD